MIGFKPGELTAVRRYTAHRLGCGVNDLHGSGVVVIDAAPLPDPDFMQTSAFDEPDTICLTRIGDRVIVRKNPEETIPVKRFIDSQIRSSFDPELLDALPGVSTEAGNMERYLYLTAGNFHPFRAGEARRLDQNDAGLMADLHQALPEWQRWFVEISHPVVFGVFEDDRLAAVSSHFLFDEWKMAAVGVLTHPDFRRRGYGKAAVSTAVGWAVDNGWICEYSTWTDNTASIRLAAALGFKQYLTETEYKIAGNPEEKKAVNHPEKKADEIRKELQRLSDRKTAEHSQRFFKTGKGQYGEGDIFLGIRVPVLRKTAKKFRDSTIEESLPLLKSKFHEERLLALFLLTQIFKKGDEKTRKAVYRLYLDNTAYINNWDLVDTSAEHIVGAYLFDKDKQPLYDLAVSSGLWDRRISIISTFYFIRRNEFADTLNISEILLGDKEDLIHKASGWMLREIGKRDIAREEEFLKKHCRIMPRTMLRYAIERFPEEKRRGYLKGEV